MEVTKTALFEKTMLPHLDAAYNLARWITRNAQDAEDAVQEAYLRAFRYFDTFTGGDGRAWILTIVRNTCLTLRSGRQKGADALFDEGVHSPASGHSTPESAMLDAAGLGDLRDCIQDLPVEYRETIVMRELEELPYKTIAEVTALPIGTVMSRLSRARKRLHDCMAAKGAIV